MSTSLLEEMGLDPEDVKWWDLALCRNMDLNDFFDNYEADPETAKQIDEVCIACPVMKQCAMQGAQGEHGVWGGTYWAGTKKPDKNKNSHKTPEVMERIRRNLI